MQIDLSDRLCATKQDVGENVESSRIECVSNDHEFER